MRNRAMLSGIHSSGQLIVTLGVVLIVSLITILIGVALALPFFGSEVLQFMEGLDISSSKAIHFGKYMQIISHLGMFIIPSFLLAYLFGSQVTGYLYLDVWPSLRTFVLSAVLIFAAVPFINFILEMNMEMQLPQSLEYVEDWIRAREESAERITNTFLSVETVWGLLFNIFMIAMIPAIGEELMFRGVLMRVFSRWTGNAHWAVWITAILFSAIHIQFFGFFPRMVLGVLFGYLVVFSGSVWPAIVAHFVNNAAAVTFFYLFQHKVTDGTYENLGKGTQGLYYAGFSLVATLVIMFLVKKYGKYKY